jgi:hypothetical protein
VALASLDVQTTFRVPSRWQATGTFELLKPYLQTEQSVTPIDYDRGEFKDEFVSVENQEV